MPKQNDLISQQNESDAKAKTKTTNSFISRNWPTILVLSVVGFYLITEHTAHLLGVLPWLIVLACPFMHIFMHRGHGHGGHDHSQHDQKEVKDE